MLSELGTLTANGSSNAAAASYHYDTHNSFSASLGASGSNANDSMIYESITSRAAPQNALYSPSVQIGGPIGMYLSQTINNNSIYFYENKIISVLFL